MSQQIWKDADVLAQKIYEEENGEGSWQEAEKYEREDYFFYAYNKLKEKEVV